MQKPRKIYSFMLRNNSHLAIFTRYLRHARQMQIDRNTYERETFWFVAAKGLIFNS